MPYAPTVYVNGQAPAINATDLNNLTNELISEAAAVTPPITTFLTNNYWVNGSTHAVSDPVPLNEMERVAGAVAVALGDSYGQTSWASGWTPPRNAVNLNKLEIRARDNRVLIDALPSLQLPTAPTGLVVTPGVNQLTLTWNANPVGEAVDLYQVYEGGSYANVTWLQRPTSPRSYVMTTDHFGVPLAAGTTYNIQMSAHNAAGYGPTGPVVTGVPTGSLPPPTNRYTDINFSAGLYEIVGEERTDPNTDHWGAVFEAYQTDARLSSWGGLPPMYYDNPGAFGKSPATSMTTDLAQRIHLFHPTSTTPALPANPAGGTWASWQELRSTDGQWEGDQNSQLEKSTLNISPLKTFGPGGFSFGAVRWFAWDMLFPLNISGASLPAGAVSFERLTTDFQVLGFIHSSDSSGNAAAPAGLELWPTQGGLPAYVQLTTTPDESSGGVPYIRVPLLMLWDAAGNRVTANFNVWHEFVVGIKFSADNSGWFEVWCDGVQKQAQTARTMLQASEGGPYAQMQNYVRWVTTYFGGATRCAVVYGGFRAGLSRADVQTR